MDLTQEVTRNFNTSLWRELGKFTNYTPLMVGDWKGDTYTKVGNNRIVTGIPRAQALLSRARYATTLALSSYLTNPKSFNEVYEKVKVKSTVGAIPLLCLIYGCSEPPFSSLFKLSLSVNVKKWNAWNPAYAKANRYHAIISRGERRYSRGLKSPLIPGAIEVEVKYLIDSNRAKALGLSEDIIDSIRNIFEYSLKVALVVLGLGKGSSRGFGKFWYNDRGPACRDIKELLDGLLLEIEHILKYLMSKDLLVSKDILLKPLSTETIERNRMIPFFKKPDELCSNKLFVRNASDYGRKIELIAKAVLKANWKKASRRKGSGSNFHTWPLGLPRSSSIKCTCNGKVYEKRKYGYLVSTIAIADLYCENFCKSFESVSATDARRVSMIHFVPTLDGIVILPLFDYSLLPLIKGDKGRTIYHVSGKFMKHEKVKIHCDRTFVKLKNVLMNNKPKSSYRGGNCSKPTYGISLPPNSHGLFQTEPKSIEDAYVTALNAALQWVIYILKNPLL
ncbi:hypothetical protein EYM_01745 [Ignicoccus islandicus DSM 13165]|uniref:Uncharacterized protein n=1 Tax=Ignicoccus islandicus DSM 13165 TaxID=940295 RepID=A0A0U3FRX6_9CREN|nr:hypothetical protein [Ignicoccus islandicus]ALU12240.1 hypothetical protein EYM_01745 [Ignicoccus islandicus DSM 13165]